MRKRTSTSAIVDYIYSYELIHKDVLNKYAIEYNMNIEFKKKLMILFLLC